MPELDRRRLLLAGAALCAAPLGVRAAQYSGGGLAWSPNTASSPLFADLRRRYVYFNEAEARFVEAACARLIPKDELGPGALKAGVPLFLDRQLGGEYGRGTRFYMKGPFAKGLPTQGYQSEHPPADLYRVAIKAIDDHLRRGGDPFHRRQPQDQDAFLKDLEAGKVELGDGVDGKAFFKLLLQNVMEGFFSDPIYGGNRGMAGWSLIGFSGARYDQRAFVLAYGKPYPLPPVGLAGRPAWKS